MKLFLIGCAVVMQAGGHLAADPLDDRLKAFREAALPQIKRLREEAAKASADTNQRARDQAEMLGHVLVQVGAAASSGQPESVVRQFEEWRNFPGLPAELKTLIEDLAKDLPKLVEERAERQIAEIDRLVKDAAPACLAAKSESDLDPLLRELSRASRSFRGESDGSERGQRGARRLQAAIRTVSMWQDYLAHSALGNPAGAAAMLQQMLQSTEYPIIPRAEVEKRLLPTESARDPRSEQLAALKRVQKIDDLGAAMETMRRPALANRNTSDPNTLQAFDRLAAAVAAAGAGFVAEAFQAAAATGAGMDGNLPPEWAAEHTRLRGLLLLHVLPDYFKLRDAAAARPGEKASEYLLRLIEELVKERRFSEAIRVLETYRTVAFGSTAQTPAWLASDLDGLRIFAAAGRLAEAGSWAEAINSFRRAAEISGKFTPATEAAQRLAELSLAHPEEVKTAVRLAETEALYQRLSREIADDAARALEARMPPEMRGRLRPAGNSPR